MNQRIFVLLVILAFSFLCGESLCSQSKLVKLDSGLYSDGVREDHLHKFEDLFSGDPLHSKNFESFQRIRSAQNSMTIVSASLILLGTVVYGVYSVVGSGQSAVDLGYLLGGGLMVVGFSSVILSIIILNPEQKQRKRKLLNDYNNHLLESSSDLHQLEIGLHSFGLSLKYSF